MNRDLPLTLDIFQSEKESKQQDKPTSKSRKIRGERIIEEKYNLQGARQTGKTFILKEFGRNERPIAPLCPH